MKPICIWRIVECEVKYADTVPEGRVELVVESCERSVVILGAAEVVTVVEVAKVVAGAVVVSAMVVVVAVGVFSNVVPVSVDKNSDIMCGSRGGGGGGGQGVRTPTPPPWKITKHRVS